MWYARQCTAGQTYLHNCKLIVCKNPPIAFFHPKSRLHFIRRCASQMCFPLAYYVLTQTTNDRVAPGAVDIDRHVIAIRDVSKSNGSKHS